MKREDKFGLSDLCTGTGFESSVPRSGVAFSAEFHPARSRRVAAIHKLGSTICIRSVHPAGLQHDPYCRYRRRHFLYGDRVDVSDTSRCFRLLRISFGAGSLLQHALPRWRDCHYKRKSNWKSRGRTNVIIRFRFKTEVAVPLTARWRESRLKL